MVPAQQEREEAIAIVDPYTSGRFLVDELCQRGWPLVAVRSSLTLSQDLISTWNPAPFERVVVHHGDLAETVESLRSGRKLRAVIAGCEPGVSLTDALAKELGLRGNGCSEVDSRCRWDKFAMHERLKECGLRYAHHRICRTVEEAAAFAGEYGQWPLIVKPCASYGSNNVYRCRDLEALAEGVTCVHGARDVMGVKHESTLVQECLQGTEYVVDCVSIDGRHFVSATWAYNRRAAVHPTSPTRRQAPCEDGLSDGEYAYDTASTVPYSSEQGSVQQQLYSYVFECLTALGIRNGASHSEVMYSETSGPCLIETGARMHGSVGPALWARCAGHEQAQAFLVADCYTEDGKVLKEKLDRVEKGLPAYELGHFSTHLDLQCNLCGILAKSLEMTAGSWIRSLPTFWMLKFFVEEGDRVEPTQGVFTSPGYVILVGPDAASVDRDSEEIRDKERSGEMYIVKRERSFSAAGSTGPLHNLLKPPQDMKHRELDVQMERLLSPLVSRAASPILSPQQAPALPPGVDELVEFTLGGAEGLLDLDDFSLDGPAEFSLDGPGELDSLDPPEIMGPKVVA